jgi:hypothetical protein
MDADDSDFANDVGGAGDTLRPSEALDSDEVRNDDGDEVVDPPDHWSAADRPEVDDRGQTLDEKLAAEVPEPSPDTIAGAGDQAGDTALLPDDDVDRTVPGDYGTDEGQISGTPEDGDSLFPVVE